MPKSSMLMNSPPLGSNHSRQLVASSGRDSGAGLDRTPRQARAGARRGLVSQALLLLSAAIVLGGCGSRPQVPTVTPRATQVTGLVANGLAMRIDLLVYNPNGYDLTVRSMSGRVTAQGTDLGTIQHAQQINLPAGQNIPFVADVTVPWGDLPSLAATAILNPSIPYRVRGRVIAGRGNVTVEAPFEIEGQIPRTMLLRIPGAAVLPIKSDSERSYAEGSSATGADASAQPPPGDASAEND